MIDTTEAGMRCECGHFAYQHLGMTDERCRVSGCACVEFVRTPPPTVPPVGLVVLGVPAACPYCGGPLVPAFGQIVEDDGTRRAVIDPASARCRTCQTTFPTAVIGGKP